MATPCTTDPDSVLESYVLQSGQSCNSVIQPDGAFPGLAFSEIRICQQPPVNPPPTCATDPPLFPGDTFYSCVDATFVCPTTQSPTPTPTTLAQSPCELAPEKRVVQSGDNCGSLVGQGGAFAGLSTAEVGICRVVVWNTAVPVLTCSDFTDIRVNDELYTCGRGLAEGDICPIPNRRAGQFGGFPGTPISNIRVNQNCFDRAINNPAIIGQISCLEPLQACQNDAECRVEYEESLNPNNRYFDVLDQETEIFFCQDYKEASLANQSALITDVYSCQCQAGCIEPIAKIDDDLLWGLQKWEVALMFTFLFVGGWVCVQAFIIWYRRNTQSKETKAVTNEIEALRVEQSNAKHY